MTGPKKFVEYFDRIVCLNLDRRLDRWDQSKLEFREAGIEHRVDRVTAVDGRELSTIPDSFIKSPGAFGLLLTVKKIIEEVQTSNLHSIMFFEDDVVFNDLFKYYSERILSKVPDDWDFLYLGGNHKIKPTLVKPVSPNTRIVRLTQTYATHAVAIKSTMFTSVLERLNEMRNPIDMSYAELQPHCNAYGVLPGVATQRPSHSDILDKNVDYRDEIK